jgi:hypothetical protein
MKTNQYISAFLVTLFVSFSVATTAQTVDQKNEYAYKHWSDWRALSLGNKPDGYSYVMLYKSADGACNFQTLNMTYKAETQKCGDKVDGWGKIETTNERPVATVFSSTKKGKDNSYQVNISEPKIKKFHDTLAEIRPGTVKGYDKVVTKMQAINTDPNAAPNGYNINLTIDRVSTGAYKYQCAIFAHSDRYMYELEGRSEADCSNLPSPHQTYWSRESQQSALSVVLLNSQNDQNAKQYVDIVLGTEIDDYHGKVLVNKTTFVIASKSSL